MVIPDILSLGGERINRNAVSN